MRRISVSLNSGDEERSTFMWLSSVPSSPSMIRVVPSFVSARKWMLGRNVSTWSNVAVPSRIWKRFFR